jgi:hypothetical protein
MNLNDAITGLPVWPAMSEQDRANLIASFVNEGLSGNERDSDHFYYRIQGIHISSTSVEYYRYPEEALYDRIMYKGLGDCDCHAILTAAIAKACGLDSAVLVMTNPDPSIAEGHAIAGIKLKAEDFTPPGPQSGPGWSASFMDPEKLNGYYACETFRKGWKLFVGNAEDEYQGSGWTWFVFPVT